MAIEEKHFVSAGMHYRTKQFNAVYGLQVLAAEESATPLQILKYTEVEQGGEWIKLDNAAAINDYVFDVHELMKPFAILEEIVATVKHANFGFLASWSGIKVPPRFVSNSKTVRSQYTAPIVSNLIQAGKATLKELEEYYSVEDAFKLFDVVLTNTVNKALANEDALKEAKRSRK
jgi:hypothetical protein